jgi:RecA/RadA recombinase
MNTEEVLSQLDPKMRKRVELASDVILPGKAKTPSFGLNRALKGGLQYGRQVLVWGNKSSGKSSMLLQTVGEAQCVHGSTQKCHST